MRRAAWMAFLSLVACGDPSPTQQAAPPTTPEAALVRHVRFLCELSPPRSADHPVGMRAAADYIAAELRATGAAVQRQELDVGGTRYDNVSALLGPAGGARVVVGAHYDVAGRGPGADDGLPGRAAARALSVDR